MDTTLRLPAELQGPVDEAIAQAVGERWASRIWSSDTSLWTDDPEVADKIMHRLGWLFAPTYFVDEVAELTAFGESIEASGYTDALVCGMGGSSLAPEVLTKTYPDSDKGLRVHVLDSTDPAAVAAYDETLDPARTIRVIATKSGSTTETLAFLAHYWALEEGRVADGDAIRQAFEQEDVRERLGGDETLAEQRDLAIPAISIWDHGRRHVP